MFHFFNQQTLISKFYLITCMLQDDVNWMHAHRAGWMVKRSQEGHCGWVFFFRGEVCYIVLCNSYVRGFTPKQGPHHNSRGYIQHGTADTRSQNCAGRSYDGVFSYVEAS